jgi:TonB family protein
MSLILAALLKTSLVLTAALALAALLRRRSAALRHWIVATGIGCSLAMPLLILVAPAWQVPSVALPAPEVETSVEFAVPGTPAPASSAPDTSQAPAGLDVAALALRIWMAGTLAGLAVLLAGLLRLASIAGGARPATAGRCVEIARAIAREHGISRPVRLLFGRDPSLLVTWGLWRPAIVLPAAARDWPDEGLRIVLRHEMAHVRRGDWGVQLAAEAMRAVYWFNPLAWISCRVLRRESEQACDDAVLGAGVTGPAYASLLLELARAFSGARRTWSPALPVARPSGLERRVRAMLNADVNRVPLSRRARLATTAAALIVAAAVAGGGALAQGPFATVAGSLLDPQRAALPGATVVITNTKTKAKNEVRSESSGRFELVGLPPGDYELQITVPGFQSYKTELSLNGEQIDRDIVMRVGTLEETITVVDGPSTRRRVTELSDAQKQRMAERRAAAPCTTGAGGSAIGGNIRPPMKVRDVRPIYPAAVGDAGVRGTVLMEAVIGTDGSVREVTVTKSAHPALDASAEEAVRQWEFTETLLNCQPIEVTMKVTVTFREATQ